MTVDLDRLRDGPLEVLGRFATASNATLLCRLGADEDAPLVVYKPQRGEAPLWDFPDGTLHRREVAAYLVDRVLGWGMVPPTVLREDGPFGRGSVQLFVEHDPARHYFVLVDEGDPGIVAQLQRMVVFDVIANNADRKGGHVLLDADGRIHLVDHGVCFHVEPKLRTVAWEFADDPVPDDIRAEVAAAAARLDAAGGPVEELGTLLSAGEVRATLDRFEEAAGLTQFPPPRGPRPFPWPPV